MSSSSSSSPSSSAVTIPIPGKSILKRAPAQQQSLFSRFTRFLPTQNLSGNGSNDEPLKRAHFILPHIATVYPISSFNPPSMVGLKEEKRAIETREQERRRRVVRGDSVSSSSVDGEAQVEEWWSLDKVDGFYKECCTGCDEQPDPAVSAALKHAGTTKIRTVDLSGVQLTIPAASILSDVFTIEWGLRKLVFKECDLDEHILKPMLHALLIPNSLTYLSVASNRRLKAAAFRLIGAYLEKSESLQFLDLSQNPLDKKAIECIVAALKTPLESSGLASLRLDDCSLRPGALEALSRAVRTSGLRNISLRYNRINATGAVALALMIRDYPDVVPMSPSPSPTTTTGSVSLNSASSSPSSSVLSLPLSPPSTPLPAVGPVLPPPRHPPPSTMQTTYTPYVPRSKRGAAVSPQVNPLSASGHPVPILASSSQGGITARQNPIPAHSGPSAALLDKVRALDSLPRLGALRTLDLKGNDLRNGITFLAQVLKRNRTLKVLNLSENKLDSAGLASIAESLKYNSCLETLDLSRNPCAAGLEGIQSLRTAFTLNTALKRLFLSSTLLTSAGAIALAEFLPESSSLLHLDLTQNQLDLASVIALESGMKANRVLRCLDLDVPPGDEEFARCCRGILGWCVRNTEEAQKRADAADGNEGSGKKVWGILDESELAKRIRMEETIGGDVASRARASVVQLHGILNPAPFASDVVVFTAPAEAAKRAKGLAEELSMLIESTEDPHMMEELFGVHEELCELTGKVEAMSGKQRPILSLQGLGVRLNGMPSPRASPRVSPRPSPLILQQEEPTTPKIDKGKAKADPVHELVLSPTSALLGDDKDDERDDEDDGPKFPIAIPDDSEGEEVDENYVEHRSKSWVTEEGEVFRKGTALLGPEEMEGEYAGEDLRKELLEAMVERPPPRPINLDEFGTETLNGNGTSSSPHPSPQPETEEEKVPTPRPYVSRSRSSSSSIMSLVGSGATTPTGSPTLGSPTVASLAPSLSRIQHSP